MTTIVNPITSIGYKVASIDEIRNHAPAAFSAHESPKVSDRYSFVPTLDLLTAFDALGWNPAYARQNGTGPYARHMVRLTNPALPFMNLKSDKVKPQIILDNSHNGMSNAQIHMGLFRLVCTNGLVVAMPGMFTSVKLRHVGIDMDELKKLIKQLEEKYLWFEKTTEEEMWKRDLDAFEKAYAKFLTTRKEEEDIDDDGPKKKKKTTVAPKKKK